MIKLLRIQNFKRWKDTDNIRMAPITLFFGANSSGKSSIGQFLMMLKQTAESSDRKAVFYPGGKNSAVQLGSYREMVFHHDVSNKIAFQYSWDTEDTLAFKDPVSGRLFSGNTLSFEAEVSTENKQQQSPVINSLNYKMAKNFKINNRPCSREILSVNLKKQVAKSEYTLKAEQYELRRRKGRVWPVKDTVHFYGFPDEVVAYHQNAEFVKLLNLEQEKLFKSIYYLGPLRTKADRIYTWGGTSPESVGLAGENTIAAILAAANRKISLGRKYAKPFEEIIALKLKEMGLIDEFKVNPISDQRQEYEVKVCTKGSTDWVDLPDVGFGISQVLPVLVQCFYAPPGSIIIMEQPEIHLHPSAQSALADIIIDTINSREKSHDRNIQLIIETHSEHFLRRLQRRIAEGMVPQEKVSAYFANITKEPASLESLQIDDYGNIKNWPENFFGDEMRDITEQAKAAMEKRMKAQHTSSSEHSNE